MPSLLETLASVGTAFTVLSGSIYFIAKALINKSFEAGIERYKMTLQRDLEAHKMTLQQDNHRFTKLHEAQCLAIRDVHSSLNAYQIGLDELEVFIRKEELEPKKLKDNLSNLAELVSKVDMCHRANKIVLPEQLSILIGDTIQILYYASKPLLLALLIRGKDRKDASGTQLGVEYLPLRDISPENKLDFDKQFEELKTVNERIETSLHSLEIDLEEYTAPIQHEN